MIRPRVVRVIQTRVQLVICTWFLSVVPSGNALGNGKRGTKYSYHLYLRTGLVRNCRCWYLWATQRIISVNTRHANIMNTLPTRLRVQIRTHISVCSSALNDHIRITARCRAFAPKCTVPNVGTGYARRTVSGGTGTRVGIDTCSPTAMVSHVIESDESSGRL